MAIQDAKYTCSCGHTTEWLLHALDHVDATGHTMNMSGAIRPGVSKKTCPSVTKHVAIPGTVAESFSGLRSMLKGG